MKNRVINLSISAADIYQNYFMLRSVFEEYTSYLDKVQFIVFDLYDYTYLNYDNSLSANVMNYIKEGGIIKEHNFKHNVNYKNSFGEEILNRLCINVNKDRVVQKILEELFQNIDRELSGEITKIYDRWEHIVEKPLIDPNCIISGITDVRYEDTIKENRHLLKEMVYTVKQFNRKIKIIFTLLPRYYVMEKISNPFMIDWKKEFDMVLNELCKESNVFYLDYKASSISNNHHFYYDVSHMNTLGGICMTSLFNKQLIDLGVIE